MQLMQAGVRCLQVLWLNTAMKVMWPYYNQAIGQQVLEQVNPIIAEQLKPVKIFFRPRAVRLTRGAFCWARHNCCYSLWLP